MEKTMWKALWSATFGDDGWIDSFFRTAFQAENTLAIFQEGQLAAGLAWMQTSCQGRKLAYLYAVATAPDFRNRGLCHGLWNYLLRFLMENQRAAASTAASMEETPAVRVISWI